MQYSSQRPQPNQFGIYGQNLAAQDIGTTNSEQTMQSSMGGVGQAMQADRNTNFYGSNQPQYQGMQQQNYGSYNQGWSQGYQQPNQYGSYGSGSNQGIGTTRTEQMMQGGMGGMQQMMQADRNTGYSGPSHQQQYGYSGGNQNYGMSGGYGGHGYGMQQQSYPQSQQYGSYSTGTNQRIGTTPTEQMLQGGMGGMQQMMQADRNTGYSGPSHQQQQYGQSGVQSYGTGSFGNYGVRYGYQQPSHFGTTSNTGTNQRIGTTPSEQMMQGSMGGVSQMMQADHSYGNYGSGQQQWGDSGGYGMQSNSGMYNPGDTMIEQQAKQSLGVSSMQTPGGDY